MTGTIEPGRLLTTLKVLLSPAGGIKSSEEVGRLVRLMEKFSRKLVSKVIYIKILKSSTPELLKIFLIENGWILLTSWFATAVIGCNWPLCSELLQVFLHNHLLLTDLSCTTSNPCTATASLAVF